MTGPTTAYPAGEALAASWDVDLAQRVGTAMGKDARARGVHFILAPRDEYLSGSHERPATLNISEKDPFLASRIAVSMIEGIEGQGVNPTARHFAGNNEEYGRRSPAPTSDERTLREIYLPAFEASVKEAKVGAVTDAYNPVNGIFMTQNSHLNNDILKKGMGFRRRRYVRLGGHPRRHRRSEWWPRS